ncbi:Nucleoside-diphosphate-sugar epimerase [Pseudomonas sp. 43mfcvi1.1]|jgi:nucleoside-diphosphate-sugar epimerase|uniref:NAD-dependent epimerase/dehydratase family protein n=1 Tax=Pseudomonas TaxID=286 RepID=UPI000D6BE36A|nr:MULTISPECIES: NAD-dependent epimerase/dehydratase family protein [Pseudomonas]AXP02141.1 NAD-dependent epimerase/dehydratase family protein [Pseudomonas fluorescens]MCD9115601.1 NAD-dependent epimerase/dehydratase family protein [Pseudomonas bijieensis]PWJ41259.1 nucleoside-diphosphate-sugar epimerase [Pseudomonas sp. 43mfcvi1.1]UQI32764.1 NAD-dependent epimerase/dehydratase family protein [Pseudomonas bijieensis]SSB94412.1 Nucleoside-diphosphate-sugar epimerase [Pseudomonas sp. 43mfcvi1.1]
MQLVTGASGYIGGLLCKVLKARGYDVKGIGRSSLTSPQDFDYVCLDLENDPLDEVCLGVETIIHLAGRAHILNDKEKNPLSAFRRANVNATLRLAREAMRRGVKRFIFVSSIGVSATETKNSKISELSGNNPSTPYALSKFEAEEALKELVKNSSMELVIIRPPLVYGGSAPGNFHRLLKIVQLGMPLPFLAAHNQRSMIALDNLIDFIVHCIKHPAAAGELFLISDGTDVSTADIVRSVANGMGRKPRLIYVPVGVVRAVAKLLGRENMFSQLFGSLVIDSRKAHQLLDWTPPLRTTEALFKAGADYMTLSSKKGRV